MKNKPKFSLVGIGLIVILGGRLITVLLERANANGILVDLGRLTFFAGLIVIIIALVRRKKNK